MKSYTKPIMTITTLSNGSIITISGGAGTQEFSALKKKDATALALGLNS